MLFEDSTVLYTLLLSYLQQKEYEVDWEMGIKTTTVIAGLLTLISTSAFAGSEMDLTNVKSENAHSNLTYQSHVVKTPALLETGYHASKTVNRRVNRVVIEPVEVLVAREVSTSDHNNFLYQAGKNTSTKTYRPAKSQAAGMPNLFKK